MPKSPVPSILIAALVLTNAATGGVLWRTYERVPYQTQKASNFAPIPNCMKDIDAKDLTYFSATAQQVSIVYRCDDKQTASSLRFYRWPLAEKPKPNNSIPFGKIQQPGLKFKFAIAQTFGKRSTETR
jgi:hypothetical protein